METITTEKSQSVFALLKPYRWAISGLALLAIGSSATGLIVPKIIAQTIDTYTKGTFSMHTLLFEFGGVIFAVFILTYLQSIAQTFTSERVARDLRNSLADKIGDQSYEFVERVTPGRLLTNLTSDIDAIKMFIGQAIVSLISSVVIVIGAATLLLMINWRLALAVLGIIPIIGGLFFFVFSRLRVLMKESQAVIDWLNKVINESVLGSALIRVLNSQGPEFDKFVKANTEARGVGLQILNIFASLIPVVTFISNLALLVILVLGGHFVIQGSMSLGDFAAFNSYISLLIFPILVVGIMGNAIARSQASYDRIQEVLNSKEEVEKGTFKKELDGRIEFKKVSVKYGQKFALKDVSFLIEPNTKTAIIGPTAAGKSQILHLLTRLIPPTSGVIEIDSTPITEYDAETLHTQIGFVFQDSVMFNMTLRENIAFGGVANEVELEKAINTAELSDFVTTLPEGLDTIISERGSSLSGGQKQRIMLARALALNPKILLLDDFTARVDARTEKKIVSNLHENYPDLTLVSITQKIAAVEAYDKIILLMEGEVLASGTHTELLAVSPEYVQIYDSQKSTSNYE